MEEWRFHADIRFAKTVQIIFGKNENALFVIKDQTGFFIFICRKIKVKNDSIVALYLINK